MQAFGASVLFRVTSLAKYEETSNLERHAQAGEEDPYRQEGPDWAKRILAGTLETEKEDDMINLEDALDLLEAEIEASGGKKELFGSARKRAGMRA